MKIFKYIYVAVLFVGFGTKAQVKDSIGSQVVTIVKAYSPTISDAFKVKEMPNLNVEEAIEKEKINYTIFSVPVASTFTPSKGKAADLDSEKRKKLYDNYAVLGFGNYPTIQAELYANKSLSKNSYVSGMFRHISSQGGINDLLLDDYYYNTNLDLGYAFKDKSKSVVVDLMLENDVYNWYGIPTENLTLPLMDLASLSAAQAYTTLGVGAKLDVNKGYFKSVGVNVFHFTDKFSSAETQFIANPEFLFPVKNEKIKTKLFVDYLTGGFEKDFYNTFSPEYSSLITGMEPSILYNSGDFALELGAGLYYGALTKNNESKGKMFIYPNVSTSYKMVGEYLITYADLSGDYSQNSYRSFANENPYVSPTLDITPTDTKYNLKAGLKGKLSATIGFDVFAGYANQANRALFLSNTFSGLNTNKEGYAYANSFQVVYDDIKITLFGAAINASVSNKVDLGLKATYEAFDSKNLEQAWNLPNLNAELDLNVLITEKWSFGSKVFFVGERFDVLAQDNLMLPSQVELVTTELPAFLDVNASANYKYNDKLTAFLKLNNMLNNDYMNWANYKVQGLQVLVGANLKFDF